VHKDDNLISKTKEREEILKSAELIKTAENPKNIAKGQVAEPRTLYEQTLWNNVLKNPTSGEELRQMNGDKRFPQEAGFVKMSANMKNSEGKVVEIYY